MDLGNWISGKQLYLTATRRSKQGYLRDWYDVFENLVNVYWGKQFINIMCIGGKQYINIMCIGGKHYINVMCIWGKQYMIYQQQLLKSCPPPRYAGNVLLLVCTALGMFALPVSGLVKYKWLWTCW